MTTPIPQNELNALIKSIPVNRDTGELFIRLSVLRDRIKAYGDQRELDGRIDALEKLPRQEYNLWDGATNYGNSIIVDGGDIDDVIAALKAKKEGK